MYKPLTVNEKLSDLIQQLVFFTVLLFVVIGIFLSSGVIGILLSSGVIGIVSSVLIILA